MTERLTRGAGRAAFFVAILVAIAIAPVSARAAPYADMVMDARSGEVLHATNEDSRLHPASLTKMMTLYVTFEAIRLGEISLDTMVTISPKAAAEPPSKLGLRAGQRIQLRYLIRAAAVKSANDAATAIGEAVGGSEAAFARRMNRTARALGMTRSTFRNAHGLTEEGHLSTARDMTILGRHLFYDYPQYYNLFSRRETDAGVTAVANTNRRFLDAYPGADGIKTGYTRAAGFNLVASAERGNKRIIATVFGGTSTAQRNARMAELLDLGFGRAPTRVAVNRPDLPRYEGLPDEPASDVVVAEADASGNVRVVGKVVRVSGAVTRSPRPMLRGTVAGAEPAGELLAAIESDVAAAVAGASGPPPAAAAAPAATEDAAARAAAEAAAEAVAEAAALAAAEQVAAATALAVAEAMGEAGSEIAEAVEDAAAEGTVEVAAARPTLTPRPRPAGLAPVAPAAEQGTAVAEAAPATAAEPVLAASEQAVEPAPEPVVAADAAETVAPVPEAPAPEEAVAALDGTGLAVPTSAEGPAAAALSLLAAEAAEPGAASQVLAPAPERVLLASAAHVGPPAPEPVIRPEPEAAEVVTRLSTSGGRHSGISVGRFPSRYEAEKALVTVSLSDSSVLGGALRRVVQRGGGFEANFMGMSEEQSALACRRLVARGQDCTTIGN